jgi:hypothetical protein
MVRLIKIVRKSGYSGYLPIENAFALREAVRPFHGYSGVS